MDNVINYIKDHSVIFIAIGILLGIVLYSMISVLINKLNSAKYGKTTGLAWVPPFNIFLLGKLVIHWIVGIILIIGLLFGICISFNISGLESIHNLLPKDYVLPYQLIYLTVIIFIAFLGKIKSDRIIREGTGKDMESSFINRDFDDKEPDIVEEKVPEVEEMIKDDFQYNHTSLSSLNNHNNDDDKSNTNNNPQ